MAQENTFQCVNEKEISERCKSCGSFDFQMSKTQENTIICAKCGIFHKQSQPSIKSAKQILDSMFQFAKKDNR